MDSGIFITFEGGEGSGKSTQIVLLAEKLRSLGYDVVLTREPGGTPIGDAIRRILLDAANTDLVPECELLLYAAARMQHVKSVIKPALSRGDIVLCDRFTDATHAYQGFARGQNQEWISKLEEWTLAGVKIDHTFLLDLPVEVGVGRAKARLAKDKGTKPDEGRFEAENLSFHQKVREGYLQLASKHAERFTVIDALKTREEQQKLIVEKVLKIAKGSHS